MKGHSKSHFTLNNSGLDFDYRKWIELKMSPEMNWSNIEYDHVKRFSIFDVSKGGGLREAFIWTTPQSLLKQVHLHKGIKFDFSRILITFHQNLLIYQTKSRRLYPKFFMMSYTVLPQGKLSNQ